VADSSALKALHDDEGCTLQLHQPQRFFDPCWRLLAAMERQLGCLVGSNAYLTPAGSQVRQQMDSWADDLAHCPLQHAAAVENHQLHMLHQLSAVMQPQGFNRCCLHSNAGHACVL
jgi:hypothetical protein